MRGFNADFDFPNWQSSPRSENVAHLDIDGLRVKYIGEMLLLFTHACLRHP